MATALGGVLTVVLLVLASVWAASVGPSALLTGDGIDPVRITVSPPAADDSDALAALRASEAAGRDGWGWVRPLAYVVEGLLALLAVAALIWLGRRAGRWLREWWRARGTRSGPRAPTPVAFEAVDDRAALAEALAARAGRRERLLTTGTPRNAIVAAWVDLEQSAAAAGVRREAWQTSAEFVLAMLDAVGADPAAVLRLSELYREARFSDHPLDEGHRDDARRALAVVHAGLRAPAPAPVGGARR